MNIGDLSKIQGLIRSSPILSAKEREEWLALVDLMDDKQLLELQKILDSNQQTAISRQSEAPIAAKGLEPKVQEMPKLSHIMNLPNLAKINEVPTSPVKIQPQPVQKKSSPFDAKLKAVMEENELFAPPEELELEVGKPNRVESGELRVESLKQGSANIIEKKAGPQVPVRPTFSPAPVKLEHLNLQVPLPPKPKVQAITAAPVLSSPPEIFKPLDDKAKVLDQALNLKPKAIQQSANPVVQEKNSSPVKPPILTEFRGQSPSVNLNLITLQDLSGLQPGVLKSSPLEELVTKVKSIISKYGYFESVFQIEKSPAFKNYIATGLNLLSGTSQFSDDDSTGMLTKMEFEKFTDLLAKIQSN